MPPQPELMIERLSDTYSPQYLELVDTLLEETDFMSGYQPAPPDPKDWLYQEKLPTTVSRSLGISEDVSRLTPMLNPDSIPTAVVGDNLYSRAYRTGPVLDQKLTPHCVTYSGTSIKVEQERKDHRRTYTGFPDELYDRTKEVDPWGPTVDGTDIRSCCKVLVSRGEIMDDPRSGSDDPGRDFKIDSYLRLTDPGQIIETIKTRGCVWFGISVDQGIFTPIRTDKGFVIPSPSGQEIGGHAMCACGFWLSRGWLLIKNSWDVNWGSNGFAWMPLTHFQVYSGWDAWITVDHHDILS